MTDTLGEQHWMVIVVNDTLGNISFKFVLLTPGASPHMNSLND